jgi:hypothetical protein
MRSGVHKNHILYYDFSDIWKTNLHALVVAMREHNFVIIDHFPNKNSQSFEKKDKLVQTVHNHELAFKNSKCS